MLFFPDRNKIIEIRANMYKLIKDGLANRVTLFVKAIEILLYRKFD